jgi:hypothetical protein
MKLARLHLPGQAPSPAQAKGAPLRVSTPSDGHEREAEGLASRVLAGGPAPKHVPRHGGPAAPGEPLHVPGSPGRPLDPATRAFMEPRFGHDFSRVRIHADAAAAQSAAGVEAAAYTVGHDVVFASGRYAPETPAGRSLLAHELAHVVHPAPGWLSRSPDTDKEKKKKAIAHHEKQQKLVAGYLKAALSLTPDPKKPLAADNLYRNTAQMIESKTRPVSLTILTGTHYSTDKRPVYFDADVQHPKIGGDYPPDRDPSKPPVGRGLVTEKPEAAGKVEFAPLPVPTTTVTKTEERTHERVSPSTNAPRTPPPPTPPPAKAPAAPFKFVRTQANMFLFHNDLVRDITDAEFRNTFVHEGQHAADLHERVRQEPGKPDVDIVLASYQSEFRAFWIQPVVPEKPPPEGVPRIGRPAIENPPEAKGKAPSPFDVTGACPCPKDPNLPPDPKATSKTVKTALKNPRQEVIFRHLISYYPHYRCFYACEPGFKKAADDFAFPVGVNVVNSPRLIELNLEVQNLEKTMKPADVARTGFRTAVLDLDAVDWAFLNDKQLSAAFWTDLDARAPKTLADALKASAKAGKVDVKALDKATVP